MEAYFASSCSLPEKIDMETIYYPELVRILLWRERISLVAALDPPEKKSTKT